MYKVILKKIITAPILLILNTLEKVLMFLQNKVNNWTDEDKKKLSKIIVYSVLFLAITIYLLPFILAFLTIIFGGK